MVVVATSDSPPLMRRQCAYTAMTVAEYFRDRDVYSLDAYVGADPRYRLPVRVISQYAWHNLFAHQLFIPLGSDDPNFSPQFTVVDAATYDEVEGSGSYPQIRFDDSVSIDVDGATVDTDGFGDAQRSYDSTTSTYEFSFPFTLSELTVGTHSVTAAFSGDSFFDASVSTPVTVATVQGTVPDSIAVSVAPAAPSVGQAVTVTADVTGDGTDVPSATGREVFTTTPRVLFDGAA